MKRKIALTLVLSLLISLSAACGSPESGAYLKDFNASKLVTLGQYKGIEINIPAPLVTEEDIDAAVESIKNNNPRKETVDGPSLSGDFVNIDFVGKIDDVPFERGEGYDFDYELGSYQFVGDLDEGIVGMSVGDIWDIPVTFPESYHVPELAGSPAVFTVTMNRIERNIFDFALTDDYIAEITNQDYTSIADFREYVRENLWLDAEMIYDNDIMTMMADIIVEDSQFKPLPPDMLNRISTSLINNITYYASMWGMDYTTYLTLSGMVGEDSDPEAFIAEYAEKSTKHYIAYQAIADIENIKVTNAEIEEEIAGMAEANGMNVIEYKAGMDVEGFKEYLMLEKVAEFIKENAVIVN